MVATTTQNEPPNKMAISIHRWILSEKRSSKNRSNGQEIHGISIAKRWDLEDPKVTIGFNTKMV